MVAGVSVDRALHGIYQQSPPGRHLTNPSREVQLRREGLLGLLVGDKFYAPKQADSAHGGPCHRARMARHRMRIVGEAMQKRSLSFGDGIHNSAGGDDRTERRISTRKALGCH